MRVFSNGRSLFVGVGEQSFKKNILISKRGRDRKLEKIAQ
jgi:hypothetical protein